MHCSSRSIHRRTLCGGLKRGYNDSSRPFRADKQEKCSVITGVEKWALSGACLIELDKAKQQLGAVSSLN